MSTVGHRRKMLAADVDADRCWSMGDKRQWWNSVELNGTQSSGHVLWLLRGMSKYGDGRTLWHLHDFKPAKICGRLEGVEMCGRWVIEFCGSRDMSQDVTTCHNCENSCSLWVNGKFRVLKWRYCNYYKTPYPRTYPALYMVGTSNLGTSNSRCVFLPYQTIWV